MVWPVVAAGIGGGLNLASAFLGGSAQNSANATNTAIAVMNRNAADRERYQNLYNAMRLEGKADQGTTDIYGNRTQYIPGRGYVSSASPQVQSILDAELYQQLLGQTTDANLARRTREDVAGRALEAGDISDELMQQFRSIERTDPNARMLQMNADSIGAINQAFDDTQEAALLNAFRTGGQDVGKLVGQLGDERGDALRQAIVGNREAARSSTRNEYDADRSNAANLAGAFFAQSAGAPSAAAVPTAYGSQGNATLGLTMNRGAQANSVLANAFSRPGGRMDYIQPQQGMANALSAMGSTAQSALPLLLRAFQGGGNTMSAMTSGIS